MQHRKSRQREKILELLAGTESHPTADWIYSRLKDEIPDLSLGTVYRNLKILTDQGEVRKLPLGSTFDRYEAKTTPHYHLICDKCGKVEDFEADYNSDLKQCVKRKSAFKILRHRIDIFGICEQCQKTENYKPST